MRKYIPSFFIILMLFGCSDKEATKEIIDEIAEQEAPRNEQQELENRVSLLIADLKIEQLPKEMKHDSYYGSVKVEQFEITAYGVSLENDDIYLAKTKITASVEDKDNEYLSFIISYYDKDGFRIDEYYFLEKCENTATVKVVIDLYVPFETVEIKFEPR